LTLMSGLGRHRHEEVHEKSFLAGVAARQKSSQRRLLPMRVSRPRRCLGDSTSLAAGLAQRNIALSPDARGRQASALEGRSLGKARTPSATPSGKAIRPEAFITCLACRMAWQALRALRNNFQTAKETL
jgi:transposase